MPNPTDSENVSSTVKKEMAREIERLAAASRLSRSAYVRLLLEDAVLKKRVFNVRIEETMDEISVAQAEGAALLAAEGLVARLKAAGGSTPPTAKKTPSSKTAARRKAHS